MSENMTLTAVRSSIRIGQAEGINKYTLSIFKKMEPDANEYPAISSENDYPFMLPEWRVNNILKRPDELQEKSDESNSDGS